MRRRTIAAIGATGALALGGTAIAAPGGGPLGLFGGPDQQKEELAGELAQKLGGDVTKSEVEGALDEIQAERREEMLDSQAKALAAELDGVSAAEVRKALEKVKPERPARPGSGDRIRPHDMLADLAKELGKSESEVRKAFGAAHKKQLKARLDEAVKDGRLTQKQADRILKRMESGRPFRMRFRHHGGPGRPGGPGGPPPGGPPPFAP